MGLYTIFRRRKLKVLNFSRIVWNTDFELINLVFIHFIDNSNISCFIICLKVLSSFKLTLVFYNVIWSILKFKCLLLQYRQSQLFYHLFHIICFTIKANFWNRLGNMGNKQKKVNDIIYMRKLKTMELHIFCVYDI